MDQPQKKTTGASSQMKEWDEYLSTHAASIDVETTAGLFTKIKYDGATEKGGSITSEEIKNRIAACREAYENVGIIGNIIDIMVDFALEDFTIVHPSKPIENFYINWAQQIGLLSLSEQILKCIYRDSNVPILSLRGKMKQDEVNKLKKAIAKTKKNTTIDMRGSYVIPIGYRVLDVLRFEKNGSEILGGQSYEYQLPSEDTAWINNPQNEQQKQMLQKLLDYFGSEKVDYLRKSSKLPIDNDRISLLYYKKDGYRKWASPMLWRVMGDVKFKSLLRNMDISVAESVQNVLTIIKLGKAEEGLPPTPAKYAAMASLLKVATKSKIIVWDNLVEITSAYPPVDKILGEEKYRQVDNDIRSGLGIPEILVNGGGGNYSTSYLSVRTLLERLETGRSSLLQWLNQQMIQVAKAMGFRKPAWVKMRFMSLQDEEVEKRMMVELVDRNMMSYRTLIERFGENFDIEVERMREEDQQRKKIQKDTPFALLKTGKFGPMHNEGPITILDIMNGDAPVNQKMNPPAKTSAPPAPKASPTNQGGQGDKGGRPAGTTKKQQKVRKTKPKGQETVGALTLDLEQFKSISGRLDLIMNKLEGAVVEKNNGAEPDVEQYDTIIDAAVRAMAALFDIPTFTLEDIGRALNDELATAPAQLERCVTSVKTRKIEQFKKNHNRAPNKKEMSDIISSAFAICTASLKKSGKM